MKKGPSFILVFGFPITAFCSAVNPDSAAHYFKMALQQKEVKKVFEADKWFRKAIDFNPLDNNLRIEYGNFLIDQRKYFPAVEQFKKILEADATNQQALQKMVATSFLLNRWTDVISYGTKLTTSDPALTVNYMLGKAYFEEEDYGLAEKFLKAALIDGPTNTEATLLLGQVYIELSNYKEALKLYTLALNGDAENNKLIYQLGLLYYTINQEKEAVKYFELAAEKGYKTDLDYKENLGMAYLAFDINKGVEILSKVLEKKPNDSEIMLQIAQAHYKAKNFQIAADAFYKVYENDPTNSKALYMTGIAYQKKGDKVLGTSLCEKAIKMDPELGSLKNLKYSF